MREELFSYSQVLGKVILVSQKGQGQNNRLKKNAWVIICLLGGADTEKSETFSLKGNLKSLLIFKVWTNPTVQLTIALSQEM